MSGDLIEVRAWDGGSALCSVDAAKVTARTLWQDALDARAPGKGISFYFDGKCVSTISNYKDLEE